jgi:hypothetical protein
MPQGTTAVDLAVDGSLHYEMFLFWAYFLTEYHTIERTAFRLLFVLTLYSRRSVRMKP